MFRYYSPILFLYPQQISGTGWWIPTLTQPTTSQCWCSSQPTSLSNISEVFHSLGPEQHGKICFLLPIKLNVSCHIFAHGDSSPWALWEKGKVCGRSFCCSPEQIVCFWEKLLLQISKYTNRSNMVQIIFRGQSKESFGEQWLTSAHTIPTYSVFFLIPPRFRCTAGPPSASDRENTKHQTPRPLCLQCMPLAALSTIYLWFMKEYSLPTVGQQWWGLNEQKRIVFMDAFYSCIQYVWSLFYASLGWEFKACQVPEENN